MFLEGFPGASNGKEVACNAGDLSSIPGSIPGSDSWVGKIPLSRKWQLAPVFLPGEFRGKRSLAGYSPWGHRVGQGGATNTFTFSVSSGTVFLKCFNSSYKLVSCI